MTEIRRTPAAKTRPADGIGRMRHGQVQADAGYDGEYGVIRLFAIPETARPGFGRGLFAAEAPGQPLMPPFICRSQPPPVRLRR